MKASYRKYTLPFKTPAGTSRGVLSQRETWFLEIEHNGRVGIGECAMLRGLSIDDKPDYEQQLQWVCANLQQGEAALREALVAYPSLQFGIEQAFRSLSSQTPFLLFPSAFTHGEESIPINGLVWMGEEGFMKQQIEKLLGEGFTCIKLKIGAIDFETELRLLRLIRSQFKASEVEIRIDANGAFTAEEALEKLKRLAEWELHSIEQPIKPRQWKAMAALCAQTPLPIALDEELIGVLHEEEKNTLLQTIQPHYLILKPSLVGGFAACDDWIVRAEKQGIGWWITSALESNIGLNAIAQYTFTKKNRLPQGLGTGSLYTHNIKSPLYVQNGRLHYHPGESWGFINGE